MNKKKMIAVIVLLLVTGLYFIYRTSLTPIDVARNHRNAKDDVFMIKEIVYEVTEDDNLHIVFYVNGRGNLSNVILEKRWFGYNVVDFNGEVSITGSKVQVGMVFSSYKKWEGWLGYGVIYNNDVKNIIIFNDDVEIVEINNMRLWYKMNLQEVDLPESDEIRIIDSEGIIIENYIG